MAYTPATPDPSSPTVPGWGSNPHHYRDNVSSLTHCTTAGTPASPFKRTSQVSVSGPLHLLFPCWEALPPFSFSETPPSFGLDILFFFFFFFFVFSRAAAAAYGSSQARGQVAAIATGPHHSHSNARSKPRVQAMSATYTTAHGNTISLTH